MLSMFIASFNTNVKDSHALMKTFAFSLVFTNIQTSASTHTFGICEHFIVNYEDGSERMKVCSSSSSSRWWMGGRSPICRAKAEICCPDTSCLQTSNCEQWLTQHCVATWAASETQEIPSFKAFFILSLLLKDSWVCVVLLQLKGWWCIKRQWPSEWISSMKWFPSLIHPVSIQPFSYLKKKKKSTFLCHYFSSAFIYLGWWADTLMDDGW